jgi:hypothetical protein
LAKRRLIDTVSSTSNPRIALDENACTASISPSIARKLSISWIMLIRIGPPPGSRRHAASAKYASGLQKTALPITPTSRPSTPDAMISQAVRRIGLCLRWWPTRTGTFVRSAASRMRAPSASVCAMGFSTSTGTRASMHASACVACRAFGVASTIPSGRSRASNSSSDA